MEEIFGMVYTDTRLKPPPSGAKEAYVALCRIYNRVILPTTNYLIPKKRSPLVRLIKYIIDKSRCCIITFNHDIMIEKALISINKSLIWFPDTGYVIPFEMYTSPTPKDKSVDLFSLANGVDSKINVLKLHGSLNWYTRTRNSNLIPSTMTSSTHIKCTRRISIHPEMTYTSSSASGEKNGILGQS